MKYAKSSVRDIAFKSLFVAVGTALGTLSTVFNEWLLKVRTESEGQPLATLTLLMIFAGFTMLGARDSIVKRWSSLVGIRRAITMLYFMFGITMGMIAVGLTYLPGEGLGLAVKIMAIPLAGASYFLLRIMTSAED